MCDAADVSGHTYIQTHTHIPQDNYNNPCCACAPRVKYIGILYTPALVYPYIIFLLEKRRVAKGAVMLTINKMLLQNVPYVTILQVILYQYM